jgi:photosystem II stability/assembly factor-like uncharacterized protein
VKQIVKILLVALTVMSFPIIGTQASAENSMNLPRSLTPETSNIGSKSGGVPFYAFFAASDDGRVLAQIFQNEDSGDVLLSFSRDSGSNWLSQKIDSYSGRAFPRVLVSGDGLIISAFWVTGNLSSILMNITSVDSGSTWQSAIPIVTSEVGMRNISLTATKIDESGKSQLLMLVGFPQSQQHSESQEMYLISTSSLGKQWSKNRCKSSEINQLYGDVSIGDDGLKMAYLYEEYGDPQTRGHFKMASSSDGGQTWSNEWRAIENPSGNQGLEFIAYKGNKIIVYGTDSFIYISEDDGKNFSRKSDLGGFLPKFVVSEDAKTIIASSVAISTSGRTVQFSRSNDGGVSWESRSVLTSIGKNSTLIAASKDFKTIGIVWSDWNNSGTYFQTSTDGGVNWNAPISLVEAGQLRLGAVGYPMDLLIYNSTLRSFFLAYQNLVIIPTSISSLRGIDIPLYEVTFDGNANTAGQVPSTLTLPGNSSIDFNLLSAEVSKLHFKFIGWSLENNESGKALDTLLVRNDLTLYAKWIELPKFKIVYIANGILEITPEAVSFWADEIASTLNRVTPILGKTFIKWNSEPNGSGIDYAPGQTVNLLDRDLFLYAQGDDTASIDLKVKQEADAKAAAELKVKQEADAKAAADKAAADLKAKQEADLKAKQDADAKEVEVLVTNFKKRIQSTLSNLRLRLLAIKNLSTSDRKKSEQLQKDLKLVSTELTLISGIGPAISELDNRTTGLVDQVIALEARYKKTTITCIKGKTVKKVTAVKPVCPAGYKVKK